MLSVIQPPHSAHGRGVAPHDGVSAPRWAVPHPGTAGRKRLQVGINRAWTAWHRFTARLAGLA